MPYRDLEAIRADIANTEALALVAAMGATVEYDNRGGATVRPTREPQPFFWALSGLPEAARSCAGYLADQLRVERGPRVGG